MTTHAISIALRSLLLAAVLALLVSPGAEAKIDGWWTSSGGASTYAMTAKAGNIVGGDGAVLHFWGLAPASGSVQYPAPTLIVAQNDTVTITLTNQLTQPVSLVFPGQTVTASGGAPGLITREAAPGGTVTYTFTASAPGTFTYYSGSNMSLQVEMGIVGALIVRPTGFNPAGQGNAATTAYGSAQTRYDHEVLYVHTEMDHRIHGQVEDGKLAKVDTTTWFPYYWFYNGRNAPDVFSQAGAPWLPTQPYDCFPRLHPGEVMLLRIVGGGRDMHPLHTHGNTAYTIAIDGKVLESVPGSNNPDLAEQLFTQPAVPGQTRDVLFTWDGRELGFDIYGHAPLDNISPQQLAKEVYLDTELTVAANNATMSLTTGTTPTAGKYPIRRPFRAVIYNAAESITAATREVVTLRVDNPTTPNVLTVIGRGEEGTQPRAWTTGAKVVGTYHGRTFAFPGVADNRFPVNLPDQKDLTLGMFYSGSPFLGAQGNLPPGEGGFNVNNGLSFMWHSHNEKELTTNNVFPGGALSMAIVEPDNAIIAPSAH